MSTTYNIAQLAKANALSGAGYAAYKLGRQYVEQYISETRSAYRNVQVREAGDAEAGGLFGLPMWSTVHFGLLDAGPKKYKVRGQEKTLPELTLYAVLMTISGSKAIVKTELAGTRKIGSVKEMMGYNDYQVRLSGVLFNPQQPDEYPFKQVNDLRRICEAPTAAPILNDLLNRIGVMDVVIEDWSFPPFPGKPNLQPFDITATSDEPVELTINNKQAIQKDWRIGL